MEPHTPTAPLLPFPFTLVSRVWHRIWDGITLPCQQTSRPSPSSGSSPKLIRFPLTPSTWTGASTRDSSPSCRPIHYNGVSSLLDVDYLRGGVSHKRSSRTSDWASLRVLNPDITELSDDLAKAEETHNSVALEPLRFPFARSSDTPLAVGVGPCFDTPRASLASKGQSSASADSSQPPADDVDLESFLLRRLKEKPRFTGNTPLPRNGLTRAVDLFSSPNMPGSSDTETSTIDARSELIDTESIDTDPSPSPRPRLPSFGSSFGAPFGLDQFCKEWLHSSPSPQSEKVSAAYSQGRFMTPNAGTHPGCENKARSSGCRSRASYRCSGRTSPSLSFMSEVFRQRRPGIFVCLGSMSSAALTLTTGTVAQKRRLREPWE